MYITKFPWGQIFSISHKDNYIEKSAEFSKREHKLRYLLGSVHTRARATPLLRDTKYISKTAKRNTLQKQLESTVQLSRTRKCHLGFEKEPSFSSLKMFSHSVSCPYHVFASWQKAWLFIDQQYPTVYTRRNTDLKFKATKWLLKCMQISMLFFSYTSFINITYQSQLLLFSALLIQ